jgi:hypothetical protein
MEASFLTTNCSQTESETEMQTSKKVHQHEKATGTLHILELHELVLLHLDMKTLLHVQHVSTQRRDIIKSSGKLQKKLFFVAVDAFEEAKSLGMIRDDDIVVRRHTERWRDPMLLNPLFLHAEHKLDRPDYRYFWFPEGIVQDTISTQRGKVSWERMLISQPPQNRVNMDIQIYTTGDIRDHFMKSALDGNWEKMDKINTDHASFSAHFDSGAEATFGKVIDKVEEHSVERMRDCFLIWARATVDIHGEACTYAEMLQGMESAMTSH